MTKQTKHMEKHTGKTDKTQTTKFKEQKTNDKHKSYKKGREVNNK